MLNVIGSVAQFDREMMLERQREGIAKAKAEGKYTGRKPTARAKGDEVRLLSSQGVGATEIAKRVGIGRASVYRLLDHAAETFSNNLHNALHKSRTGHRSRRRDKTISLNP